MQLLITSLMYGYTHIETNNNFNIDIMAEIDSYIDLFACGNCDMDLIDRHYD